MNIIIREPIILECGKLFAHHLQWRLHTLNVQYGRIGDEKVKIEQSVFTCDANGCDELLNIISTHFGDKPGVSLMRESAGYYVLQVYHD